jgi:hypothetical protein
MRWIVIAPLAALAAPHAAFAKDLNGRWGFGFTDVANAPTALTARFVLPGQSVSNIVLETRAGLSSDGDDSTLDTSLFGVAGLYGFVIEDHLNVYAGAAVDWVTEGGDGFLRISPGLSFEYFPFGVEFLGLTAGFGLAIDTGGSERVETFGNPAIGVTYYL